MQNDSTMKTIGIAAILCIVCSILVSASAVILAPRQEENKQLDLQKNLLSSAGLIQPGATKAEVEEAFKKIDTKLVDLSTGKYVDNMPADSYDQKAASKDPKASQKIPSDKDIAKIRTRENLSKVFLVREGDKVVQIVLPIRGKGLWSTLWGFIAIKPDTKTVAGLSFYEHAETPGLGGEIENPRWRASWVGKELLGDNFQPKFLLVKGGVTDATPDAIHKVDSLAGATLTSVGVQHLITYWFGQEGFGPYLEQVRANGI